MSKEYKVNDTVPDLYAILGLTMDVCNQPNCDELIQKAYYAIARKFHPDRNRSRVGNDEHDDETKRDMFEVATAAYDVLKKADKRDAYNKKIKIKNQSNSDFFKLRSDSKKYSKMLGDIRPPTDVEKLHFNENMKMLDSKHSYNRDDKFCKEIPENEAIQKFSFLEKKREKDSLKYKPDKIFDDKNFNLRKFNAAFDKIKKTENSSMIEHSGAPAAWNDYGSSVGYSDFDDFDNLYTDDMNRLDMSRQNYGSINFGDTTKISKTEVDELDDVDYVDNHNVIEDDYYQTIQARLSERNSDSNMFDAMTRDDYNSDLSGYGIFDQLGYAFDGEIAIDDELEDDITSRYEKLLLERNKDIEVVDTHRIPKLYNQTKQNKMAR